MLWSSVQVGLDLATSVTILAAALTWWLNKRKERKIGVLDSARSTIIENINTATNEMASSFNQFANFTSSIERKIDSRANRGQEHFIEAIISGKINTKEITELFAKSIESMRSFYEKGSMLRYTIFPSLYSIGNEEEAVAIIKKEINDVMISSNESQICYLSYITEILSLLDIIQEIKESDESISVTSVIVAEHMDRILSIVDDKNYGVFLADFLSDSDEAIFLASLEKTSAEMSEQDKNIRLDVLKKVTTFISKSPEEIIARFLKRVSCKMQENRIQCKEFLVTLSAVSSKMQQRSGDFSIKEAYDVLSSEHYLDTKGTIR